MSIIDNRMLKTISTDPWSQTYTTDHIYIYPHGPITPWPQPQPKEIDWTRELERFVKQTQDFAELIMQSSPKQIQAKLEEVDSIDENQSNKAYVASVEVPGYNKDSLLVEVRGKDIFVETLDKKKSFLVLLEGNANLEAVRASCKDGLLRLEVPIKVYKRIVVK